MSAGRITFTGTLLRTGRVPVVGGPSSGGVEASAEQYDGHRPLDPGRPAAYGPAGTTRHAAGDGTVLVAGGLNAGGRLREVEVYDPARGRWKRAASMTTACAVAVAALLADGGALVAGGGDERLDRAERSLEVARAGV